MRLLLATVVLCALPQAFGLNLAPYFTADMNQHTLLENTPVGSVIYTLKGEDPEGSNVKFGLKGTDKLSVDPITGEVKIVKLIDRESRSDFNDNEIRLMVVIEDEVGTEGEGQPNVVEVPISVIILDENDNPPVFRGLPYKALINEDTPVGTTIFRAVEATDPDLVGEVLDVKCNGVTSDEIDACEHFEIVPRRSETDHDIYRGSIVLRKPLDYRRRQIYRLPLLVYDGNFTVDAEVVFSIADVQNSPPVFVGAMTGVVNEDDQVGTEVLTVRATDGDTGNSRRIVYNLVDNPNGYFVIDPDTGVVRIDKTLNRESLGSASGGVLSLKVRASELINGVPASDESSSSVAEVTITIRDVNDEPPTFNAPEYKVTIPENMPYGTPLGSLDMEIRDTDTGPKSAFKIELIDESGKFSVEPNKAVGHTAVSLKLNSKNLDYENPNERKFLLLIVATETETAEKLSSTATVTVDVTDLNDNVPVFERTSYTAIVNENATAGTEVITIVATDRDADDFGTDGIRYELTGSELFQVDPISGTITVAPCVTGCLDYEETSAYFLSYSAADNNGEGKKTIVNLRITVADANDNPPIFEKKSYVASINEGQDSFDPALVVVANDADTSSVLRYTITDGNVNDLFTIDRLSGEISVRARTGLKLDNMPSDKVILTVDVTDGDNVDTTMVDITVNDVNDRNPIFERQVYEAAIPEDSPVGMPVEQLKATDADIGLNAQITYRIQKGSHDDFVIDPDSGKVSLLRELDFDRRNKYTLEVVAVDAGIPRSLSGTATLVIDVLNKNDKKPHFSPATQRAHVTEDTLPGAHVIKLTASDLDATSGLTYSIVDPVLAVDKDGKPVEGDPERFSSFFTINSTTGDVFVGQELDRSVAASVTMRVQATDESANPPQYGFGNLVVTIVDINDFAPTFPEPWTESSPYITINVVEEQPNGTIVYKFVATDADSNIESYQIRPKNPYFFVEPGSGNLIVQSPIDFETLEQKRITFDLIVYDAGVPQKSASAIVVANIENINDETPVFEQKSYHTNITENSPANTPILTVKATDSDEGEFGHVTYSLSGTYKNSFSIGPEDGIITVVDPAVLDREELDSITLQVVASDSAPIGSKRSSTIPVKIDILDENDNPPRFTQAEYSVVIVDNIPYHPDPSPIVQVLASDPDQGINSELYFNIAAGNEEGQFSIDHQTGVIFPNASFLGKKGLQYELTIDVTDEAGQAHWDEISNARVIISIDNVNTHKPEWLPEPPPNEIIEIEEELEDADFVIMKVNARDNDVGADNSRVGYFFKVNNENVGETESFSVDEETGEVRAKVRFDREEKEKYELVLVARDHGTPVAFETLRFVTVMIKDVNDNTPSFQDFGPIRFTVPEEEDPGYFVGRVEAKDPDKGKNGRVFYYIVSGNDGKWFSVDKTYGNIYTKQKLDREEKSQYQLMIKTTNEADHICEGLTCDIDVPEDTDGDPSFVLVQVFIEDKNDNLPRFESDSFYVGVPFDAKVGDLILDARAEDPDIDETGDGDLFYAIRSSNLYRSGSVKSAGSLVPSPFIMEKNGRLVLATLVTEFNQDGFVIEIEARESNLGHLAKATVYLWIYEPDQLIKVTISKPPEEANLKKDIILRELRNATKQIIVLDDIRYHVSDKDGLRRDMTDMFVHAVNKENNEIMKADKVLEAVDANYDYLSRYYEEAGVKSIVASSSITTEATRSQFNPNLAALIALLLVLFLGLIMFSIVCCCLRNWVFAKAVAKTWSKPQKIMESSPKMEDGLRTLSVLGANGIYNAPTSVIDDGPGGTENPLWIDQKYKAYEEQELTMTVFSDQDNSVISGNGQAHSTPQNIPGGNHHHLLGSRNGSISRASHLAGYDTQSNAYATINKVPISLGRRSLFNGSLGFVDGVPTNQDRDYATLEKYVRSPPGPIVPGIHSAPFHQGSLPRRYSNDFGPSRVLSPARSNITINQNGEPELVADLI